MFVSFLYFNRAKEQDVLNVMGAIYCAAIFLGAINASSVQAVVAIERTAFYRERAAGMYSALPYAFAQVTKVIHPFKSSNSLYSFKPLAFQRDIGKVN